jgi:hypothetical protein
VASIASAFRAMVRERIARNGVQNQFHVFSQSSLTWHLVILRFTEATLIKTFQWQRFTFLAAIWKMVF